MMLTAKQRNIRHPEGAQLVAHPDFRGQAPASGRKAPGWRPVATVWAWVPPADDPVVMIHGYAGGIELGDAVPADGPRP
ncbi:hypothetical protein ABZT04_43630 [Streptomyces sp. NPDC005492]|uniref:hypothetical protein n=1 Tax=Streptomyces sp. NPDC005492 TaxID=3156883 RepID=UPI00339DB738